MSARVQGNSAPSLTPFDLSLLLLSFILWLTHSFIHSFTQQVFLEHLFCVNVLDP